MLILSFFLFQMLLLDGANAFYFYTQWTFTLVIIYFAIGTVISAHGCWKHLKRCSVENEEANGFLRREFKGNDHATLNFRTNNVIRLQDRIVKEVKEKRAGFWGYTMQIIYQICAGSVMLTDIVFWCLLVPFMSSDHFTVNVIMFCMHSLNAIFLLLDTVLNSLSFPWFRMAYFVFWSCTYVVFQWVLHACGFTWWPYPFLGLATPWAPAWYLAMALVHVPCYIFYWLVVKAKNHFFPKWFPHAYIRSY